jgi:hypothetical protein
MSKITESGRMYARIKRKFGKRGKLGLIAVVVFLRGLLSLASSGISIIFYFSLK